MEMVPADGDLTNAEAAGVAQTEAKDKSLISEVGSPLTGTSAGQAAIMDGSAGNMVSAAGTGFKIEPSSAAIMAKSCLDGISAIDDMQGSVDVISKASNLGTLHGAQVVANFTQGVATNPGQGYADSLKSLRATLVQMAQAYQKASTNYEETNQQIADAMKNLNPGAPSTSSPAPSGNPTSNNGPTF